jgi:hypothetical protein
MEGVTPSKTWWRSHRLSYNLCLVGAGISAFLIHCAIIWTRCPPVDEFEITAFTVAFQAAGYLIAMGLSNVFYFLGPWSEGLLHPKNTRRFRSIVFGLGVAFSVALPFLVPLSDFMLVPRCR